MNNFLKLGGIDSPVLLSPDMFRPSWRDLMRRSPHTATRTFFVRMPGKRNLRSLFDSLDAQWCDGVPFDVEDAVLRVARLVNSYSDPGRRPIARAMIVKLPPGGVVAAHVDTGAYAAATDRFHAALQTNPGATFRCGTEFVHMAPGEVWWFDKRTEHGVSNGGDTDRIHLIVDMFK